MTQDYAIWKPQHDGHAPPNWQEGMKWGTLQSLRDFDGMGKVRWDMWRTYYVSPEALNSPNDDAEAPDAVETGKLENIVRGLRQYPAEELAKHGITLAPERDWATELWADLLEAWGMRDASANIRDGRMGKPSKEAISILRTRFEQMKGEG